MLTRELCDSTVLFATGLNRTWYFARVTDFSQPTRELG